jgi:hypothetical protein
MNSTIQLSLYDLTPEPLLVRVPFVSSKHPWEMSEEEYEVYEDTILYHNRPSVSGRDNPFQEFLTGQEADVFLALKAGETVPPEVLARFEELKEWHETGSSPIIRENEERLRKRQEEIANRPAIGTEQIHQEEDRADRRVIYVEPRRLEHSYEEGRKKGDIDASYSGDMISNPRSTVRKPFHFENGRYVSTGTGPAKRASATVIYLAMFDEVDEGTAIFKCANDVPVGGPNKFLTYEGLPSDFYLQLTGSGAKLLRGELPVTDAVPVATR